MNLAPVQVERTRKKDGAYPFARLSLASTRCLIEDAAGRFAGYRKKDRGPMGEEAEPEGQSRQVPPRDRRPFPRPQTSGSDAPHVWAAQFSRPNRRLASGRVGRLRGRPRCTQYTF